MAYTSFVDRSIASPLPKVEYRMPNPRGLSALRNVVPSVASTEAATPAIAKSALGRFGARILGKAATGLKIATGPIGAGIAAGQYILGAREAGGGEDEKLRQLGMLPPLPGKPTAPLPSHGASSVPVQTYAASPAVNSISPIPPLDTTGSALVDGNRINYNDIGNPLKDAALINSKGYSFGVAPSDTVGNANTGAATQNGSALGNILKSIQAVAPVQDYASRVGALNTGNTTWDMNSLDKILAAKAGHQADTERYQQQVGALTNLGSAQMQAEAAREGHLATLAGQQAQQQIEREKNAYMAPYYSALGKEAGAKAEAAPLAAKADVLKALAEQSKNDPILKASLDTMTELAKLGDRKGYNAIAAKLALITGKLIPPLPEED